MLEKFREEAKEIGPGQEANVYSTEFLDYLQPSAWAAMFDSYVSNVSITLTKGNDEVDFCTNDDDSWIVRNSDVIRSRYGSLWQEDPGSGQIFFPNDIVYPSDNESDAIQGPGIIER